MKSKFDVREYGTWSGIKHTAMFAGYVVITFIVYIVFGSIVRRAYRKAIAEDRTFYVDRLPFGKADQ